MCRVLSGFVPYASVSFESYTEIYLYTCVRKTICKREQQKCQSLTIYVSKSKWKIGNKSDHCLEIFSIIWKRGQCVLYDLRSITRPHMSDHQPTGSRWLRAANRCVWPASTIRQHLLVFTLFHVHTLLVRLHTACFIHLVYLIHTCIWIFHLCYKGESKEIRFGSNLRENFQKAQAGFLAENTGSGVHLPCLNYGLATYCYVNFGYLLKFRASSISCPIV